MNKKILGKTYGWFSVHIQLINWKGFVIQKVSDLIKCDSKVIKKQNSDLSFCLKLQQPTLEMTIVLSFYISYYEAEAL